MVSGHWFDLTSMNKSSTDREWTEVHCTYWIHIKNTWMCTQRNGHMDDKCTCIYFILYSNNTWLNAIVSFRILHILLYIILHKNVNKNMWDSQKYTSICLWYIFFLTFILLFSCDGISLLLQIVSVFLQTKHKDKVVTCCAPEDYSIPGNRSRHWAF